MEVAKLVLEYLKVFLSTQIVAGAVVAACLLLFRPEFRSLLNRIAKIKLPGGTEVSTSQIERSSEELPARGEKPVPLPAESSEAISLPNNGLSRAASNIRGSVCSRARARIPLGVPLSQLLSGSQQSACPRLACGAQRSHHGRNIRSILVADPSNRARTPSHRYRAAGTLPNRSCWRADRSHSKGARVFAMARSASR